MHGWQLIGILEQATRALPLPKGERRAYTPSWCGEFRDIRRGLAGLGVVVVLLPFFPFNLSAQNELLTPSVRGSVNVRQSPNALALSPDGRWGAVGARSGDVVVFSLTSLGTPKLVVHHKKQVNALAFNRAGTLLASAGDDGVIKLASLPGGQIRELRGHKHKLFALAFAPDGQLLASGGEDREVIAWDPNSGAEQYRLDRDGRKPVRLVGFNAMGTTLLSIDDSGVISEWDANNRSRLTQVQDSDKASDSAAENFAGTYLAIGSEFTAPQKGTNLPRPTARNILGSDVGRPEIGLDPSSVIRPIDLYRESRIKIYDLSKLQVAKIIDGINGQVVSISISADNQYVAVARQRITESFLSLYDILRATEVMSFPVSDKIRAVAFSADGQSLASAADNGEVKIYAIKGIQPRGEVGDLRGMKFSVTSSQGGSIIPTSASLIIGVMPFEAHGVGEGVAQAVVNLLRTQITSKSSVRLVDRTKMAQILEEQNFQYSSRADPATAIRLGRVMGARKMISGNVSKVGTSMTIYTQMVDVETGMVDGNCNVVCQQCDDQDLIEAVARLKPALVADSH